MRRTLTITLGLLTLGGCVVIRGDLVLYKGRGIEVQAQSLSDAPPPEDGPAPAPTSQPTPDPFDIFGQRP